MASVDSLPPDQRAVLQLVLQRGRSYDEIARLLSIDRGAVRERALTAFDALGPQTGVPDQRRALIADYLLGQLPASASGQTRDRLAESPSERAWARVLASELAPLASAPLPEIPVEGSGSRHAEPEPEPLDEPGSAAPPPSPIPSRSDAVAADASDDTGRDDAGRTAARAKTGTGGSGASSRRGGLIVLLLAVIIVAVVIGLVVGSGDSSKPASAATSTTSSTAAASSTPAASSSTTSASSSTASRVVAQINLKPTSASSKAAGIAEVLRQGATDGIAIVGQNVPANSTKPPNAYAVWLYNSPSDAHILGFVNPGVGVNGRLSTAGGLPANASHYKQLIVTVEAKASPTTPGTIILQGTLPALH